VKRSPRRKRRPSARRSATSSNTRSTLTSADAAEASAAVGPQPLVELVLQSGRLRPERAVRIQALVGAMRRSSAGLVGRRDMDELKVGCST
jgi:hypothetical protein